MRRLLEGFALLVLLAGMLRARGEDDVPAPAARAFLEVRAPESVWAGEPFDLILRIGLDREFFRTNVVPLFARPLDLEVQVRAPWLLEIEGAVRLDADGPDAAGLSLAGDDEVLRGAPGEDREVDGRTYRTVEIERRYLLREPGVVSLDAPSLRFGWATDFERDFLTGSRALDRNESTVTGPARRIEVLPLPAEGRPVGFTNAVGRFEVRGQVDRERVRAGESFRLRLRIEGEGNLWDLDPPSLEHLSGFHVFGRLEQDEPGARVVVYDLAATDAAVTRVPGIPFAFFDPAPPVRYRIVTTEPIPLRVGPAPGEATPPGPGAVPLPIEHREKGSSRTLLLLLASLALGGLLILVQLLRSRARSEPPDPRTERAAEAAAELRRRTGDPDVDLGAALADYLSARLGCPPAAVVAPDLPERLERAGIPGDLARRTATLLEELVGTRYGGTATGARREDVRHLVDVLEEEFTAVGRKA